MNDLSRTVEALLFLSPKSVTVDELADACEVDREQIESTMKQLREQLAQDHRGIVLREVAGGFTFASHPDCEAAAKRLLSKPRTPSLSQAQAEVLSLVAYQYPISRPEIARIRGVHSESAVSTLLEGGLIEESGRSQFGAVLYRTTELFERQFGLARLGDLPDAAQFDPDPGAEEEIKERLFKAGDMRAGVQPQIEAEAGNAEAEMEEANDS